MKKTTITRDSLLRDDVGQWKYKYGAALDVLSAGELDTYQKSMMQSAPNADDNWVFAYGSLMWNPAINFVEQRVGTVYGYHRAFCLRSVVSRGTPSEPGLMLGLERGGACRSPAYRIATDEVETELTLLFRREMMTNVYRPRWLRLHTTERIIPVLAFVMNPHHSLYAKNLTDQERSRIIATARGSLGHCSEYLLQTVASLQRLNIRDRGLETLARRVEGIFQRKHSS